MSKYINFDKLRHLFEVWKEIEEKAGNDKGAYCYNECINAIDKATSPDVVEIVRCKDCKYYETSKYIADDKSVLGFCKFQEEPWWDTEFCSYGERKGL